MESEWSSYSCRASAASAAFVYIHLLQVCDSLCLLIEFELIFFLHFDFKQKLSKAAADVIFFFFDCWSFFAKEILWKPNPTNILRDHRSHLNLTMWCVYLPSQRCEACGKGDPTALKRPSVASLLHIGALTQTPRSEWAACCSSAGGGGRKEQWGLILKLRGWREKKGKPSFVWEVLQSCGCRYAAHLRRLELGGLWLHPPISFTSFLSLHYILMLCNRAGLQPQRFSFWNHALPTCQAPIQSIFSWSEDSSNNRPF